jgi:hypothetical protein
MAPFDSTTDTVQFFPVLVADKDDRPVLFDEEDGEPFSRYGDKRDDRKTDEGHWTRVAAANLAAGVPAYFVR